MSTNPSSDLAPAPKRRKNNPSSSTAPSRRVRGRLQNLPGMPLDILFEIFGHLQPLDLLRLARTTKDLRGTLMRRSTVTVWRQARANVGDDFPDCPPDLSEPAYANLAFDTHCHFCLNPRAGFIMWISYVRSCKRCLEATTANVDALVCWEEYSCRLPHCPDGSWSPEQLLPTFMMKPKNRNDDSYLAFFYDDANDLCELFNGVYLETDCRNIMSERLRFVERRDKFAMACEEWEIGCKQQRTNEKEAARRRRLEAIVTKLTDLGWGYELSHMSPDDVEIFFELPVVKQAKDLTERIWRNMEPFMIECMVTLQEKRIAQENAAVLLSRRQLFKEAIREYADSRPLDEIVPEATDLYYMDEVAPIKSLIENTPLEDALTMQHLADFIAQLPQLARQWRASKTTQLISKMSALGQNLRLSTLYQVESLFRCTQCSDVIRYPWVLSHRCCIAPRILPGSPDGCWQVMADFDVGFWDVGCIDRPLPHLDLGRHMRVLVALCGLAPSSATFNDLDKLNPVFNCTNQGCMYPGTRILDWKASVNMHSDHPSSLRRLDTTQEAASQAIAQASLRFFLERPTARRLFVCQHCTHRTCLSLEEMNDHLQDCHELRDDADLSFDNFKLHPDPPNAFYLNYRL
ncbi:hypothetical protein HGRIS_012819 [Hohenbuehelia grisea]|uniref:F-box domain-containing protein n=1 Tax=Hohenbuehelia grisea TaxID=104357 RepID=A0ABR3ITN0_9AGAR